MTNYNGQTITYDEIGNPINYRNGMTMSWQAGRQLESITQNGKTYNFAYAHDGLRTKKSITSGNTTVDVNYIYEGDKLLQMTYDDYVLTFSYDANGIPVSFHVKNATLDKDYYYGTNSRGDIEVIYNADGTLHARYDYDAYGKILSVTAPDGTNITAPYAIANLNPLRYRSYVYDNETGLYYLQSRYYDPVTCRFINADAYMSTGQGITGNNMFAYCNNNPVSYSDSFGTRPIASMTVAGETDDEKLVTFAVMNNREVPTSGTGSASEYVPSSSKDYNCYAYALGETEWMYVGGSPNAVNNFNVDIVASMVMEDVRKLGFSIRPIDSYDSLNFSDEYRIALRTANNDYHFMLQHNDGTWSHKPSVCPTRPIASVNPSDISWDGVIIDRYKFMMYGVVEETGLSHNYYNSKTVYFAVSK